MKSKLKVIIYHPLFSGSMIMIIGGNATNFINYIYHLSMGRMLGPGGYGELAVLLSLMGLVGIIPLSLGLVIIKFISSSKSENKKKDLASWFSKKTFILSVIIFSLITVSSPFLASYLNIASNLLIIMIGVIFLFLLPSTFNRAVLQSLLRFKEFVISILLENGSKLIFGVLFVILGLKVFGAVVGLVIAVFLGWILSRYYIRGFLTGKLDKKLDFKPILLYSLPIAIQSLTLTSLYSVDVILVKHFFPSHDAGIYAALSTLGRIIYFGASPVSNVMFPLVVKRYAAEQNYNKIFLLSFFLTSLIAACILIIYWVWPDIAISLLYGSSYLEASPYLVYFGVFITLLTITNLIVNFYLSLNKVKVVILPFLAAIVQAIGIYFYHENLQEVIKVSVVVTTLLVITLFVYFAYENKFGIGGGSLIQAGKDNSKGSKKNKKHTG